MALIRCSDVTRRLRRRLQSVPLFAADKALEDARFQSDEAGLSLISILAAVLVVTIFAAIAYGYFSTSGAKSKALYDSMASIAHAAEHFNLSLGTYPTVYGAMATTNFESDNTGGLTLTNTWNGPYAKDKDIGPNGNLHINNIASGATITFAALTAGSTGALPNGLQYQYALVANNIPANIAEKAVDVCNGQENNTGATNGGQCVLVTGTGTDTIYYIFAQNAYGAY